ncbi:MAG: hypothetical protein BWY78_00123 [Alphaproteobacteria bacterium ADurb.Bin438]|nr:MAG: hypothetical protein BWY78_00123 [Alphaproteobacteria bacterium ADurb.Bin438]
MNSQIVIPKDIPKEELLAYVRDLYPLPEVGSFPLAFGWWVVIFLVLTISLIFIIRYKSKRLRIRKKALEELNIIYERYGKHKSPRFALGLSIVLRKVAIITSGRQNVANLYGKHWIEFLLKKDIIPFEICNFIAYAPYAPIDSKIEIEYSNKDIINLIKKWVEKTT